MSWQKKVLSVIHCRMPEEWGRKRARVDASIGGLVSRFRLSREHKENPVTLGVDGMCYSSRSYPEVI
jgi:hypothetical protein